jgi:Taurine catabolism dioxygenase TauD, TfdA family
MPTMLESLAATAAEEAWAAGSGSMEQVLQQARALGWTEVSIRRGGPSVATLRPVDPGDAPTNSLSAKYGKGAQPLHTDGAHLPNPPDVVVLVCAATSGTPTQLWRRSKDRPRLLLFPDFLSHGVFLVVNGKDSFFSTAYSGRRLRYDPGCMIPCDARAREAVRYFEDAMDSAYEHSWDEPDRVLLIDNRKALHARPSAVDDSHREIRRVSFYLNHNVS